MHKIIIEGAMISVKMSKYGRFFSNYKINIEAEKSREKQREGEQIQTE